MEITCKVQIVKDDKTIYEDPYVDDPVQGSVPKDALATSTVTWLNAFVSTYPRQCDREALELLGRHLYALLFNGKTRRSFEYAYKTFAADNAPDKRLRLVLEFHPDAEQLASYPWEFICMPRPGGGEFLAASTQLVLTRFVPVKPKQLPLKKRPLRILVAFCHPPDLPTIEGERVIKEIKNLQREGEVKVDELDDPTFDDLKKAITAPDERPHILHFIGHGWGGRLAMRKPPEDLERERALYAKQRADYDRQRQAGIEVLTEPQPPVEHALITSSDFRLLFKTHRPRLVFLHACNGAKDTSLKQFRSVARELIYENVPGVVAMQYEIDNDAAMVFAREFYQALGEGEQIGEAVTRARISLATYETASGSGSYNNRKFGTPVVYLQSEEPIVLPGNSTAADNGGSEGDQRDQEGCPYGCGGYISPGQRRCVRCRSKGTSSGEVERCPNCRHLLAVEYRVCGYCDYEMPAAAAAAPRAEAPLQAAAAPPRPEA